MRSKASTIKIKAGPDDGLAEGQFTAYASVFGNKDSYGDVVIPGAFAETIAEWAASPNALPLLFGHNMSDPDYNIGHVISAEEDEHGLLVTAQLDLETAKGAQTYRLLKGRRISQMSFAYDVLEGAWIDKTEDGQEEYFYELRKLRLYEVSVVTIGANQETEILAVKSAASAARHLASDLKSGRPLTKNDIDSLRTAQETIGAVIAAADAPHDQAKASGTGPVKSEEPAGAKGEEPDHNPSVITASTELELLALT